MSERPDLGDLPMFSDDSDPDRANPWLRPRKATNGTANRSGLATITADLTTPITARTWLNPTRPAQQAAPGEVDWALVRAFRQQAADELSGALRDRDAVDPTEERELGDRIVRGLLKDHADGAITAGHTTFSHAEQEQLRVAVMNSLFGLGRLQPLVDNPDVENIRIAGHANVRLDYYDGRIEHGPPVADSDEELIEQLQFLCTRQQANERPFSPAHPRLHMRLDGGSRLAASAWVSPVPQIVIRRHRIPFDATLSSLATGGLMQPAAANLLAAAISANKNVVISGGQGVGKALALDTPVPTPTGWTTMGALRAGDRVFGADGRPCTVTLAHEIRHDRPCYEVGFDDGSTVVADAEHLWRVTRRVDRQRKAKQPRPDSYVVSAEERDRLHRLAEAAAEQPDRQVTVRQLADEVGHQHITLLYEEANHIGPCGKVRVYWADRWGGHKGGKYLPAYSRQQMLKALAVRRDTPRGGRRGPEFVVVSTEEMANNPVWSHPDRSWRTHDYAVDLAQPLEYASKQQIIDPYVLGIWLGDGATSCARITTADAEVIAALEDAGYPCKPVAGTKYDYSVGGSFQVQLRTAHLLGDKHIPREYLQGDRAQRLALLQGLMDSDGTCSKSGLAEFTTTLQVLADQVYELVCGLGYKANMRTKPVRWKGRDCGTSHYIAFTTKDPVFRLERKATRQSNNGGGPSYRYITSIQPVESVPVRCITVDSPDSLYLVGKACIATHNTTLARALCLEIDPWEQVATIETEYELHLHELPHFKVPVFAFEGRPGAGERGPDGRQAGEVTLDEHVYDSWRFSLQRLIVGEVRGKEIHAMWHALSGGGGSICTVHANSARSGIERLVTLSMEAGPQVTPELARRKIAEHIDFIVQLKMRIIDGQKRRWISEILAVESGDDGGIAVTDVFTADRDSTSATPRFLPQPVVDDLTPFGFNPAPFRGANR